MLPTNAIASLAIVCVILVPIGGCEPSKPPTTIQDLESQLTRQIQEQWPNEPLSGVTVTNFMKPVVVGTIFINVRLRWGNKPDSHFVSAGLALYRAADDYLVGTLEIEGKPPANVVLKFE